MPRVLTNILPSNPVDDMIDLYDVKSRAFCPPITSANAPVRRDAAMLPARLADEAILLADEYSLANLK